MQNTDRLRDRLQPHGGWRHGERSPLPRNVNISEGSWVWAFTPGANGESRPASLLQEVKLAQQRDKPRLRSKGIEHRILAQPREELGIRIVCAFEVVESALTIT